MIRHESGHGNDQVQRDLQGFPPRCAFSAGRRPLALTRSPKRWAWPKFGARHPRAPFVDGAVSSTLTSAMPWVLSCSCPWRIVRTGTPVYRATWIELVPRDERRRHGGRRHRRGVDRLVLNSHNAGTSDITVPFGDGCRLPRRPGRGVLRRSVGAPAKFVRYTERSVVERRTVRRPDRSCPPLRLRGDEGEYFERIGGCALRDKFCRLRGPDVVVGSAGRPSPHRPGLLAGASPSLPRALRSR